MPKSGNNSNINMGAVFRYMRMWNRLYDKNKQNVDSESDDEEEEEDDEEEEEDDDEELDIDEGDDDEELDIDEGDDV